jgi:hypothetical protein
MLTAEMAPSSPEGSKLQGLIRVDHTLQSDSNESSSVVPNLAGQVVRVNSKSKFVVIKFPAGIVPPLDGVLTVYRENEPIGTIKVTPPLNPPLASGDIIKGSLRQGDLVR